MAGNVDRLFKSLLPDVGANEFTAICKIFAVIAAKIRSDVPAADISEVMEEVSTLLDYSIATHGYIINPSLGPLVLDPFIILEPCTECHRPELLLLDKFSEKKITYLGYESGHKPSYANVGKLPLALREAASGTILSGALE